VDILELKIPIINSEINVGTTVEVVFEK